MSPLGGFCWPGAEKTICRQTFGDVAHITENTKLASFLLDHRGHIDYPIAIHPIVEYALVSLIHQRMRVVTIRNNSPKKLQSFDHLAPEAPNASKSTDQLTYRMDLIHAYLTTIASDIGIDRSISTDDYTATSRFFMIYQYDLDVVYATLGTFHTSIPEGLLHREAPLTDWPAVFERTGRE